MRTLPTSLLASVLAALLLACAGQSSRGQSPKALKTATENFFRAVRWRDFTGAGELIAPDKRDAFEHGRRVNQDAKNLEITDYDLERITLAPDALSGKAIVRMSWMRVPSVTLESAEVETGFVYQDGHWLVESMDGGPFPELR